ncbi:MAG: TIGR03915 family putative DNA repair protein [Cytophagaceae bacterium]|nr:TIGR03915 family putative DNA repair protein [Cytophagaceae bacterium]
MITYVYDGSFEGYLTTVFEIYNRKKNPDGIFTTSTYMPFLMEEKYEVSTNIERAQRVLAGIESKGSKDIAAKIYNVYLSEHPAMEMLLFQYIKLILQKGSAIEHDYRQPEILKVKEINKQIHREVHRMHAFVRFQKTTDNLYYATVTPDFNVLPLIGEHFEKRYSDQHFMIYDSKRNYGLYYDQQQTMMVECGAEQLERQSEFVAEEKVYEALWKNYFQSVNIIERKNVKLHLRHMPKRYWKHLTEKK